MSDTEKAPRWIEYVRVEDLPDALVNPKAHDDEFLDESLERFGFTEPGLLDERTGRLIAGHGRKATLLRAEAEWGELAAASDGDPGPPPVPDGILLDPSGLWLAPIVRGWASKDDDEALAYLVASNAIGPAGGWVIPTLADVFSTLQVGAGLYGVGFTGPDIDDIMASLQESAGLTEDYGGEGAHDEDTAAERQARYAGKGIRSLVLDYPVAEFDVVAASLARLRRERGLTTNAATVAALVAEAVAGLE